MPPVEFPTAWIFMSFAILLGLVGWGVESEPLCELSIELFVIGLLHATRDGQLGIYGHTAPRYAAAPGSPELCINLLESGTDTHTKDITYRVYPVACSRLRARSHCPAPFRLVQHQSEYPMSI